MGMALDDRNEWKLSAESGVPSDDMRMAIELYRANRDDPAWRASRYSEILGECASAWLAAIDDGRIKL